LYESKPAYSLSLKKLLIAYALLPFFYFETAAQTDSLHSAPGQIDIIDVAHDLFKGLPFQHYDTSAGHYHKLHFPLLPLFGYSLQTSVVLGVTCDMVFKDGHTANTSNILASLGYSFHNQVIFFAQPLIWTKENKYLITGDIQYLKYPSKNYGLGGYTLQQDETLLDYSYIKFHLSVARKIIRGLNAGIGYAFDDHWNITETINANLPVTDFQKYGRPARTVSSGPTFKLIYDTRGNAINPQGGLYANITYRPNFMLLGSDQNWQSLLIDVRKYVRFPASSNNILAFWSYNWLTLAGNPPYLDLPSTQWDMYQNTGRGYIQGRFRGKNMVDLETEYRFGILKNGLVGGVVFANAQSFSEWPSNEMNHILPGYGAGLRFKIDKNTNTNVALDYALGTDGSRGVFLNLCEVF
jgi:hypothetical protein